MQTTAKTIPQNTPQLETKSQKATESNSQDNNASNFPGQENALKTMGKHTREIAAASYRKNHAETTPQAKLPKTTAKTKLQKTTAKTTPKRKPQPRQTQSHRS